jgi:hypothetical protein
MINAEVSGIKYSDVEQIIEKIALRLANKYKSISFLDPEDIKQEVRLKCFSILGEYNSARHDANIQAFFSISADNRLRDLKRGLLYNPNNDDQYAKNKLSSTYVVEISNNNMPCTGFLRQIEDMDFLEYVHLSLPSGVLQLYCRFSDSNFSLRSLKLKEKEALFPFLVDILHDFKEESYG